MSNLEGFLSKPFAQQILLLDECESASDSGDIARLGEFMETDGLDESLRQSIADTLISLLRAHPTETLKGLGVAGPMRRICIQVAGDKELTEASTLLDELARGAQGAVEGERIAAYTALTKIDDERAEKAIALGVESDDPIIAAICSQHLSKK